MGTPNRYYSATAVRTQLKAAVSASSSVISVTTVTGFPSSTPFTLVLDPNQITEEVVTVTAVSGLNLNVSRGQDGTNALSHDLGAVVMHALTARDLREPQEHIAADAAVHGITGKVVGTTDSQGLTNKTINGSLNTFLNIPKAALPADTIYTNANATLGDVKANGLSLGTDGVSTQRILSWFFKNPTNNRNYERRDYLYNGSVDSGAATVIYENGVETARLELLSTGKLQIKDTDGDNVTRAVLIDDDTGWVSAPPDSPYNGTREWRRVNGLIYINLKMGYTGGNTTGVTPLMLMLSGSNVPTRTMFSSNVWVFNPGGPTGPVRTSVDSNGEVRLNGVTVNNGATINGLLCFPLG